MKATFHHLEKQSDAIYSFWFEPEKPLSFTAGQFTELTIPHAHADSRGQKRWFTISSSPTEDLMAITTKFSPTHGSSFKHALRHLKPGAEVTVAEAMGDFVLPKLVQTPLIFIAGGIGLTPFHSIFKWLIDTGERRDITFIYAVHSEDDIIFQDIFEKAGIHATIVVAEPSNEWGGARGRITAEMMLGLHQPTDETLIYLSGPEPMIEALQTDLRTHGINKRQLVTDFFPGYTSL